MLLYRDKNYNFFCGNFLGKTKENYWSIEPIGIIENEKNIDEIKSLDGKFLEGKPLVMTIPEEYIIKNYKNIDEIEEDHPELTIL